jgi:NAD-dependent dihydropyrimidine dehydrogenase PreA subunit
MVVICGQNNYKLDTKYVINGVVVEGTLEGEVDGLNTNNCVACEFCAKNAATCDLIEIIFFTIFKICFMFPGNDLHWRFYYIDRQ